MADETTNAAAQPMGDKVKKTLKTELIKDTGINVATLLGAGIGAAILYMMVPEKKRPTLFK